VPKKGVRASQCKKDVILTSKKGTGLYYNKDLNVEPSNVKKERGKKRSNPVGYYKCRDRTIGLCKRSILSPSVIFFLEEFISLY
jgi:hypothetical protein